MNVVAYFVYGDRPEYELELALSVASARASLGPGSNLRLVALTDGGTLTDRVAIERVRFSREDFQRWTRGGTYVHRAKVFALARLLDHFQEPVALVDTDTLFTESPERLFDRVSATATVMHQLEGRLGQSPEYRRLLERLGGGFDVEGIHVSSDSKMFNSGVVGLHPGHRSLLDRASVVLDAIHDMQPIFNVEQFAIGAVLDRDTSLTTVEHVVKHYWGFERAFFHVQSARVLPELLAVVEGSPLPIQPGFPPKRFMDRVRSRLRGAIGGWHPDYRFAYLAQLCALSSRQADAEYACAWADLARSLVARSAQDRETRRRARQDFYPLARAALARDAWMSADVRTGWLELWETIGPPL